MIRYFYTSLFPLLLLVLALPNAHSAGTNTPQFLALGAFSNPGPQLHSEEMDTIRAITGAKGITKRAALTDAVVYRPSGDGGFHSMPLDLVRLLGAADMSHNIRILPGDVLFIPFDEPRTPQETHPARKGNTYILGEVQAPGAVQIEEGHSMKLKEAIEKAGGFTEHAARNNIRILRQQEDGGMKRDVIAADMSSEHQAGESATPLLQPRDVVIVPGLVSVTPEEVN